MDERSKTDVSIYEFEVMKNDAENCPSCCSNNSSSSCWTNVSQSEVESSSKLAVSDNDYRRQEMISALAWATCKTFKYRPSDPIHYLAHQLLRWRHGYVSERNATGTVPSVHMSVLRTINDQAETERSEAFRLSKKKISISVVNIRVDSNCINAVTGDNCTSECNDWKKLTEYKRERSE